MKIEEIHEHLQEILEKVEYFDCLISNLDEFIKIRQKNAKTSKGFTHDELKYHEGYDDALKEIKGWLEK